MQPSRSPVLVPAIYFLAMVYAVVVGFFQPTYNWDMLCYVGSVTAWSRQGADAIFTDTLAIVKSAVPDWVYNQHAANPLSNQAASFVQVLPFCQVKPLYNASVWTIHEISGLCLARATWTVSTLCFALLGWVMYRWRLRFLPQWAWVAVVLALCFVGELPMATLARLSTPDCIATLASVAALYQAICWRRFALAALFGWLAVMARPDAAFLIAAMAGYFSLRPALDWRRLAVGAAFIGLLGASVFLVGHLAGSYGWQKMFVYSFFNRTPTPAESLQPLDFAMYQQALVGGAKIFVTSWIMLAMIAVSLAAYIWQETRPIPTAHPYFELLLTAWAALLARFVSWPAWGEDRFYYAFFILIPLLSGEILAAQISTPRAASTE